MAMTTIAATSMDRPLEQLREEYESLPGLRLTIPQVARLLAVDRTQAALVLDRLEAEGLLFHVSGGAYRRSAPLLS